MRSRTRIADHICWNPGHMHRLSSRSVHSPRDGFYTVRIHSLSRRERAQDRIDRYFTSKQLLLCVDLLWLLVSDYVW